MQAIAANFKNSANQINSSYSFKMTVVRHVVSFIMAKEGADQLLILNWRGIFIL